MHCPVGFVLSQICVIPFFELIALITTGDMQLCCDCKQQSHLKSCICLYHIDYTHIYIYDLFKLVG